MLVRRWAWQRTSPLIIAALPAIVVMVSLIAGMFSPASADTLTTNVFINAGGDTAEGFVADTAFDQGNQYTDTSTPIDTSGVSDPAPQAVYQTCRWNSAFTYTIPGLTVGAAYTVRLHWAELTWKAKGQRLFHVAINNAVVLSHFDVFATVGYKKALFTVNANNNGQIVIAFTQAGADNPFLSGIQVLATQPATAVAAPTAPAILSTVPDASPTVPSVSPPVPVVSSTLSAISPTVLVASNPNKSSNIAGLDTRTTYPGDDKVDVIGPDFYDMFPAYPNQGAWDADYNATQNDSPTGIGAWIAFANVHNKPLTFPEWGLNTPNSTDNPFYINKMADTFATLRGQGKLYWESYFNLDGCTFQVTDGCNPNASATYVQRF